MEWENAPESVENLFGFIYLIERINALPNERRYYYGKKQFHRKIRRPPLKGKTRKRIDHVESDWKEYYGSSENLLEDLEKHGKENFRRTILKICSCKWECAYEELKVQLENNVLHRDDCYNGIINLRIGRAPKLVMEEYRKAQIVLPD